MIAQETDTLATISTDGDVPECRMENARAVQDFCRRLIQNDERRSWKRSRVNGLVDGNPPYKQSKLREAGRAEACNVNFGIGRSYMESGSGAFYDLFSEAPGFVAIRTSFGNDESREIWSGIMREEADRILSDGRTEDGGQSDWDYEMQQSQWNMVLHGCGPLLFEDGFQVLPKAAQCGDLKVPEFTKSSTKYFDACMIEATYYPPQLYEFIKNPEAAAAVGWDVEYTKLVIANAMNVREQSGIHYDWEFYQQELKNNSLTYYDDSKVCRICHVFWKEFSGRISHVMVERDTTINTVGERAQSVEQTDVKYLFKSVGRYASFRNCIHPMYFDHGNGGYHHSVTGLGVKMFSAMEYQNRLLCNLGDKAFAPKIIFNPTSTETSQKFQLVHMGDWAVMPGGFEINQTGVAGLMDDGLAMNRQITDVIRETLSTYRQGPMKKDGNPVTAKQVMYDASQQSSLSKTTYNRYYKQLDQLYMEIVRRLCNINSPDEKAKEFQKRCEKRGVPKACFGRIDRVEAVRVIGQGNAFMRKQAVDSLGAIVGALPEEGRNNWLNDKISAEAGQYAVSRYNPPKKRSALPTDQKAEAMQWVGLMKVGVPPVVTSSQNPTVFAETFLAAASQAMASMQQGANPMEVLQFVEVAGPAIGAHLKRISNDPTRQEVFKVLNEQWEQLAKLTDKLKRGIQQMQQQAQEQQQSTQQAMSAEEIAQLKAQSDIQLKTAKTAAQLKQSQEKHALKMAQGVQQLGLKDAQTASEIARQNALAKAAMEKEKSEPAAKE